MSHHDHDSNEPGVATTLPCPDWCALASNHPLATTGGAADRLYRVHKRRFGERATHVVAEAWERAVGPAGPSDLGTDPEAFLIRVELAAGHGYVTASGARRLAHLLTEAADVLDHATREDNL
ncbi:hypothetical protein RB608_22730 [Nocardioides sp. LHD-245]|uniref:hypothetical protein n=1 Tax=Nocardioides sp. LHD-245 TaxID=3051387 RepID=UPI0027E00271|nr:hypothetical protein [Nocardioides sp. LHD-245]